MNREKFEAEFKNVFENKCGYIIDYLIRETSKIYDHTKSEKDLLEEIFQGDNKYKSQIIVPNKNPSDNDRWKKNYRGKNEYIIGGKKIVKKNKDETDPSNRDRSRSRDHDENEGYHRSGPSFNKYDSAASGARGGRGLFRGRGFMGGRFARFPLPMGRYPYNPDFRNNYGQYE